LSSVCRGQRASHPTRFRRLARCGCRVNRTTLSTHIFSSRPLTLTSALPAATATAARSSKLWGGTPASSCSVISSGGGATASADMTLAKYSASAASCAAPAADTWAICRTVSAYRLPAPRTTCAQEAAAARGKCWQTSTGLGWCFVEVARDAVCLRRADAGMRAFVCVFGFTV
jgi:hypothetical protein